MTLSELMDKAKERANLPSDYALAKALGIKTGIISNWRKGKRHPSNEEAVQLATLAGLDEMRVIAEIELLTAKTEKKQSFWKCYLEQRGITAALCLVAVGASIMLTPSRTDADVLHLKNYGENQANFHAPKKVTIYIMRTLDKRQAFDYKGFAVLAVARQTVVKSRKQI